MIDKYGRLEKEELSFRLLNSEIGNDLAKTTRSRSAEKSVFVSLTRR